MPALASTPALSRPLLLLGLAGGLLAAAAAGLWAFYGTAMFFEILRSGFAACF